MRIPRPLQLHHLILIGMFLGVVLGAFLHAFGDPASPGFKGAIWWLDLLGKDFFIRALKMIIAPLILASIVSGIGSLPNPAALGRIGVRTFAYYFITTCVAVAIGLAVVLTLQPGKLGASLRVREARQAELAKLRAERSQAIDGEDPLAPEHVAAYRLWLMSRQGERIAESDFEGAFGKMRRAQDRSPGDMFREDILFPLLSNPIEAMGETNALGIIVFAILLGLGCIAVGEPARPVIDFFTALNHVMMKITLWLMGAAPVALGCIAASLVATLGADALRALAWYCAAVIGGIALHVAFLVGLAVFIGKVPLMRFLRGVRDAWIVAFTTTSSAATLPVTIECVTENLKVSPKVANFGLPIGATMNMDGTALYEGVAVIFLIQLYGGLDDVPIAMTGMTTLVIFVTAVLASVGAAAVPSAGLITMALVAGAVGLPIHYVAIIYAVDHFLDMFRTSTNVLGDIVGAVIVDRMERDRGVDEPGADRAG